MRSSGESISITASGGLVRTCSISPPRATRQTSGILTRSAATRTRISTNTCSSHSWRCWTTRQIERPGLPRDRILPSCAPAPRRQHSHGQGGSSSAGIPKVMSVGLPSASFRFDYSNPNTGGLLRRLTIGVAAIPDAEDTDHIFVLLIEKYAVVAATQPKASSRRLELLDVTGAAGQVTIQAVKNLHRGLAVNRSKIGTSLRGPDDRYPLRCGLIAHFVRPNSRRISEWGIFSPLASDERARSSAAAVSDVISSSSTGTDASERPSGSTIASSSTRTAFSFSAGSLSSNAWACWRSCARSDSIFPPSQA